MGKGKAPERKHFNLCTEEEAKAGGAWIEGEESPEPAGLRGFDAAGARSSAVRAPDS